MNEVAISKASSAFAMQLCPLRISSEEGLGSFRAEDLLEVQ